MTGVLDRPTARQDVLIRRGADTEWAIRWENSTNGGTTFNPVDMSGDEGTLLLLSPLGEVWLQRTVSGEASGMVVLSLSLEDFSDPVWATRSGGAWLVNISHEDRLERLGEGNFILED